MCVGVLVCCVCVLLCVVVCCCVLLCRISVHPCHVKGIIEELSLEGAKPADTPVIVISLEQKSTQSRHATAAGRNKDHVVAVVDVRCAFFYAEPLPMTSVELPDYLDLDTRTRCCGTRQAARSWQSEVEGIKAAGMVMGKMPKCSFKSPCGKLVGVVHSVDNLFAGPRSRVDARESLRKRHETRVQMMGAGPTDTIETTMLNQWVQWTEE